MTDDTPTTPAEPTTEPAAAAEPATTPGAIAPAPHITSYFDYQHLPAYLQPISAAIFEAAMQMQELLPEGAEKTAGLRKLLEAKDCFVRAALRLPH